LSVFLCAFFVRRFVASDYNLEEEEKELANQSFEIWLKKFAGRTTVLARV
jgi:hypothetical protein